MNHKQNENFNNIIDDALLVGSFENDRLNDKIFLTFALNLCEFSATQVNSTL